MKLKRHLIFDMDGVLWDTCAAHERAFLETLSEFDLPNKLFRYSDIAGMSTSDAFTLFLKSISHSYGPDLLKKMVHFKRDFAHRELSRHPEWAEGSIPVLERLSRSHVLALASSGSRDNVHLFMDITKSRDYFKVVLSSADIRQAKPDPEIYLTALQQLHASTHDSMVIEDSAMGVRAATEARLEVIGVAGTLSSQALRSMNVKTVIEKLEDLLAYGPH